MRRSFPLYIAASLIVVYSADALVLINRRCRHRKDSLPTIDMHVDVIYKFAWILRYMAFKYVFTIKIFLKAI